MIEYSRKEIADIFLKGKSNRFSMSKDADVLSFIRSRMSETGLPEKETVYCYINDIVPPKCKNCREHVPAFLSCAEGFKDYCSIHCHTVASAVKSQETKYHNIQLLVEDLEVDEIIHGLYHGTLKIQHFRSIEKLQHLPKFNSLTQMYKHVVLGESQICEYCDTVLSTNPTSDATRKCICTSNEERMLLKFLSKGYNRAELLNFIVDNRLYRDGIDGAIRQKIRSSYYRERAYLNENISFTERIFCDYHRIEPNPDREFINFKLGYKEEVFNISFEKNQFLENIDLLREKYSNKGIYTAREAIGYCRDFLGRNMKETIYLQEAGQDYIPVCKSKGCENLRRFDKHRLQYSSFCQECICDKFPGSSVPEQEILLFIKCICPNEEILENYRGFGKEFDIYIPSKNLAIEFNGLYWHSSKFKDSKYHLNKTNLAEDNDIQLLHIFEHEWEFKQDIIKSIIRAKVGVLSERIFARKCEIREVASHVSNSFLVTNHIQGKDNSPIRYGLYHNDILVSLMTFKRSHRSKTKYMELKRFCSILNTSVVGGFPKLLKYARSIIKEDITSFGDRRFTYKNNVYQKSGFELESISPINYFYYVDGKARGREQFQKHKLSGKLKLFNESFSARKNMHMNGLFEIYDSGNLKYVIPKL